MLTAPVIADRFLNLRFHRIIQSYPRKGPQEISYCISLKWNILPYISWTVSGSVFSTPRCSLFKAKHMAPWWLLTGHISQPFAIPLAQLQAQPTSPISSLKRSLQYQTDCPSWGLSSTWWGIDLRRLIRVSSQAGSEGSLGRLLLSLPPLVLMLILETSPPGLLNIQRLRHQDAHLEVCGQLLVLIKCQLTS